MRAQEGERDARMCSYHLTHAYSYTPHATLQAMERLRQAQGNRINKNSEFVITSDEHRERQVQSFLVLA